MKSQAEIAGRLTNSTGTHPQTGTVLRDLELTMADGGRCLLSSLRGSTSLVMVFAAGRDLRAFLADLAGRKSALQEHNGRVLIITMEKAPSDSQSATKDDLFLSAIDSAGTVHKALGAMDAAQLPIPSIYITDRFGEVFAAFQNIEVASLPKVAEIIRWLEFIEQQCEECSPPEWPE